MKVLQLLGVGDRASGPGRVTPGLALPRVVRCSLVQGLERFVFRLCPGFYEIGTREDVLVDLADPGANDLLPAGDRAVYASVPALLDANGCRFGKSSGGMLRTGLGLCSSGEPVRLLLGMSKVPV